MSDGIKTHKDLHVWKLAIDTFDGAKPRLSNRGKKRRSVSTLSIFPASDRGVEGVDFVTEIYQRTDGFPKKEEFGLKSQIRRAVVSIPANISEGGARNSTKEFLQFFTAVQIGQNSCRMKLILLVFWIAMGQSKNQASPPRRRGR